MTLPTITDTDAYHEARQTTAWLEVSDDTLKTAALTNAADYVSENYTLNDDVEEDDQTLLNAIMALAPAMLAGRSLAQTADVLETEDKIGELETRVVYAGAPTDPYPSITRMLRTIARKVGARSGTIKLVL
jgi:hypothetical protein